MCVHVCVCMCALARVCICVCTCTCVCVCVHVCVGVCLCVCVGVRVCTPILRVCMLPLKVMTGQALKSCLNFRVSSVLPVISLFFMGATMPVRSKLRLAHVSTILAYSFKDSEQQDQLNRYFVTALLYVFVLDALTLMYLLFSHCCFTSSEGERKGEQEGGRETEKVHSSYFHALRRMRG